MGSDLVSRAVQVCFFSLSVGCGTGAEPDAGLDGEVRQDGAVPEDSAVLSDGGTPTRARLGTSTTRCAPPRATRCWTSGLGDAA
ncbi:MAG: hypothetical protein AB8I08_26675 [Sandaracinaceae bacterium]